MTDRLLLASAVLAGCLTLGPALAASGSESRLCHTLRLEPPLRVEACTRALQAPDLSMQQQVALLGARGRALDELGDYKRAIADYDAAIVLAPQDPVLHLNRGVAKIHDGRPADAIPDYEIALRLKPDWHLPYFDRAVALGDLGQRAAALKDFERAIRLKPDDAWIYVGQGDVLAASGNLARALAAYDKALALRPELDDPRAKRAAVLLRLDRPAEALPELDRVLAAHPSKPHLWQTRGAAKFQLARYADAAADFARTLALAPQDSDARRALARAYLGAGDPERAWQAMMPALDSSRQEAADLALGALIALHMGRVPVAEALARRAGALQPGEGTAQAILALALWRQRDAQGARNAAALSATFAPQDAEIAAIARRMGARASDRPVPPPPRTTPAKAALAECIASLETGDRAAARAAGPGWSLCRLAAGLTE